MSWFSFKPAEPVDDKKLEGRILRATPLVVDGNTQISFLIRVDDPRSILPSEDQRVFHATFSEANPRATSLEASVLKAGDEITFEVHPDSNWISTFEVRSRSIW